MRLMMSAGRSSNEVENVEDMTRWEQEREDVSEVNRAKCGFTTLSKTFRIWTIIVSFAVLLYALRRLNALLQHTHWSYWVSDIFFSRVQPISHLTDRLYLYIYSHFVETTGLSRRRSRWCCLINGLVSWMLDQLIITIMTNESFFSYFRSESFHQMNWTNSRICADNRIA